MRLSQLLALAGIDLPSSLNDVDVTHVTSDSRKVWQGSLFFALKGAAADGYAFIPQARKSGACAIVTERARDDDPATDFILTPNARQALAITAAALVGGQPKTVMAVTGTNGKTSTVDFLRQLWTLKGKKAASLGTLGLISPLKGLSAPALTTPDAESISTLLFALHEQGIEHVAIEASSHGLDQHRLDGIHFAGAAFTNLTRDHLDYHENFSDYRSAKLRLFSELLDPGTRAIASTACDATTLVRLQDIARARSIRFVLVGADGDAFQLLDATPASGGQYLDVARFGKKLPRVFLPLIGRFQAENALLAAALACDDDDDADALTLLRLFPHLRGVPGRCENVAHLPQKADIYVDYAHTPDALEHLLLNLRPHVSGRLILIFGAGGNRDPGKRVLMGKVAAKHADLAIITDDNPRFEDPALIRRAIRQGCPDALEIAERARAIETGIGFLLPGDALVIAGKGHENGQIYGTTVTAFNDRACVQEVLGK